MYPCTVLLELDPILIQHGGSNRSTGRYPTSSSGSDMLSKTKSQSMRRVSNTSNGEVALDNGELAPPALFTLMHSHTIILLVN